MGKKTVRAWHFVGEKLRDGKPVPADEVTLKFKGKIIPCQQGYHASLDPYDALQYAPGNTLCLVECGGEIIHHGGDKLVAEERKIIHRIDFEQLLRKFARQCALNVIHLWNAPTVVVEYLKTGDEHIRDAAWAAAWAAWDAAEAAARDAAGAARDAAGAAARAARDAARDAARAAGAAARDAAWAAGDAAWAAAWAAAWTAAWAAGAAAWAAAGAARDAARAAEKKKQRDQFNLLVNEEFKQFLTNLD